MLQSLGLATTISEERQISAVLEQWNGRDRRDVMFEPVRDDPAAHNLLLQIANAQHDGD